MAQKQTGVFTPLITVSGGFLSKEGLWDNCIVISDMVNSKKTVYYNHLDHVGKHVKFSPFSHPLSVQDVTNQIILLLCPSKEYEGQSFYKRTIIRASVSGSINDTTDEYIILMVCSNKDDMVNENSLWEKHFTNLISKTL